MQQQSYTPSSNGIQSFADASPEYELSPIGLASMHEQAQKLAEYGRNGDIYVVHAAEGETVVPMEVLNENPKIKELLFKQMEEMGLDPQEFVVGNELNSINPDTGLPEFFISRVFRSVKKAVKKVVKIAKKVAPVVLPIAAAMFGVPFLGPTFGAGTFGASFLGSGIGSLIGGASIKDSLKAGLISGGIAGLTSGFTGPGSFGENLSSTFTGATPVFDAAGAQIGTQYAASPFADALGSSAARQASAAASKAQFGNLFSGDPLSAFTGENTLFGDTPTSVTDPVTGAVKPGFVGTAPTAPTAPSLNPLEGVPKKALGNDASLGSYLANRVPGDLGPGVQVASTDVSNLLPRNLVTGKTIVPVTGPTIPQGYYDEVLGGVADNMSTFQNFDAAGVVQPLAGAPKSLTERLLGEQADKALTTAGDYLTGGGRSAGDIASDVATAKQTYLKGVANDLANAKSLGLPVKGIGPTTAGLAEAAASAQPGMLAKYGPTAGIGLGAAYLGGAFDPPPEDNPDRDDLEGYVPTETGYDLFQKDPQKYLVQDMNPFRYDPGNPSVPTRYTSVADGGYMEKPQYMNMGGTPQFPRREMLVEGPGTERSDDIPAMLSDGEFVMNARAVRGADPSGNGNRQAGAANLYNMMRNFEMRS